MRRVEAGVVGEDGPLEAAQLGSGLDSQLLDEGFTGAPVGLQCVGLAAGPIERKHELRMQALAPRLFRYQLLQLGDQLGVAPDGQVGVYPHLQGGQALLFQACDHRRRERLGGQLGQRRPPPEPQCLAQHDGGPFGVPGGQRPAARGDELLKALGVELAGAHPQAIARRSGRQHSGVAERLAQA